MPSTGSGDPIRPPICPDCDKAMRLERASPDERYINLKHMIFMCKCGQTSSQLVRD